MLLLGIQRWAVHIPDCILHCYWSKLSLFIGYSVHFTLILVNCNPVNENTCTFEEPVFFYLLYKVFFVNIFKDQEVICVWLNVAHCTLKQFLKSTEKYLITKDNMKHKKFMSKRQKNMQV